MVSCLDHTKRFWTSILGYGDVAVSPSCVDVTTVELLEFRAPQHYASDKDLVTELIRKGELFPTIVDKHVRILLLFASNTLHLPAQPSVTTFERLGVLCGVQLVESSLNCGH